MSALAEALQRIETYSKCQSSYWRPQLTYEKIDAILQDYPFRLPKEVYELYLWRNGTLPIPTKETEEEKSLLERFNFGYHLAGVTDDIDLLPLEEAMFWWQARDEWHRGFITYKPSNVFPLFCAERGAIAVLGGGIQQDFSPIYWVDDPTIHSDQEPLYPSLTYMMLAIAEVIESGAKVWEFGGICDRFVYERSCRVIDEKYGRSKRW